MRHNMDHFIALEWMTFYCKDQCWATFLKVHFVCGDIRSLYNINDIDTIDVFRHPELFSQSNVSHSINLSMHITIAWGSKGA